MIGFVLLKYLKTPINEPIGKANAIRFFYTNETKMEYLDNLNDTQIIINSFLFPKPDNIVISYNLKGKAFIKTLEGEFTLGIWDNKKKMFFGARDRLGIKPFYYYNDDKIFIYSSSLKFIKEQLNNPNLSNQWIADTLSGIYHDQRETQIQNIKRLPPGHFIEVSSVLFKITRYWKLTKKKQFNLTDQEYINLFQEKLHDSITKRISASAKNNIGTELSGGLDSSGITCIAASLLQEAKGSLYTFSHILTPNNFGKIYPFNDEQKYIDLVINKYKIEHGIKKSALKKGIINEMQKELRIHGVPISNTLSYFSDVIYDSAKDNKVEVLLSGFGGDQGISSQSVFRIIEIAKKMDLRNLKAELGVDYTSKKFIKTIFSNQFPSLYKWYRLNRNIHKYNNKLNSTFINQDFGKANNIKNRFWETYSTNHFKTLDELLLFLINDPFIQERTETTGESARNRGVEYSFPYLDSNLLEFYYSVPNHLKYNNGRGRYIYREALKNILPKEIYNRTDKKISTVPAIFHRFNNDYNNILDFLHSIKNKNGSEFIDINSMINRMPTYKNIMPGENHKILNIELFMFSLMLLLYLNKEY